MNPTSAVEIRAATKSDLAVVQDLARRIWHRHYPGIITVEQIDYMLARGYQATVLETFLTTPGSGLALARVDEVPVGFAAWCRAGEPATTRLDKLYVLQAYQRQGIGRRLIAHVEAAAGDDSASALILNVNKHNAASIAMYQKCGFVVREAIVVDIGNGFVMDDYVISKRLRLLR